MRRALAVVLLLSGCFDEAPDPDRTIAVSVTQPIDMGDEESSSSSEAVESTSEESGESSSSSGGVEVPGCPEWCNNGCDDVIDIHFYCRCNFDEECEDGLVCEPPMDSEVVGHCR